MSHQCLGFFFFFFFFFFFLSLFKIRDSCLINKEKGDLTKARARNNGRSTDNVRTDCGFDWSKFRLAGHVDRWKFNRIENEINLKFLLFSCFSCYLSSRCELRNFELKSWWHALEPLFTIRASKQTSGLSLIKFFCISPLYFTFILKNFKVF